MKKQSLYEGSSGMRHLLTILNEAFDDYEAVDNDSHIHLQAASQLEDVIRKLSKMLDDLHSISMYLSGGDDAKAKKYIKYANLFAENLHKSVMALKTEFDKIDNTMKATRYDR